MTKFTKHPLKATTISALDIELKNFSLLHPNKIITCWAKFGTATAYIHNKQPTTESPDTIQTYEAYGGFWKKGKIISPTKTWLNHHNFIPISRG